MKSILSKLLIPFLVGVYRPYNSSESRMTIVTNVMLLWSLLTLPMILSVLQRNHVDQRIYIPLYSILLSIIVVGYICNVLGKVRVSRFVVVLFLNFAGFQAALFYGKSFNGYWGTYIIAIVYTIFALSRETRGVFWLLLGITMCGLPVVDILHWQGWIPVTGLDSSRFGVSVLLVDTITLTFFLAIMLIIEKSFYDRYEDELKDLNENLERIVKKRTRLLVDAKEEAIQASLLKSQFVANTSHELRTPVQGIIGFVGMAQRRLEKMSDLSEENRVYKDKVKKSLSSTEESSDRLLSLIETLLNITRTESVGFTARPSRVSLRSVLEQVISEVNSAAGGPVKMDLDYCTEIIEVVTDPILLSQVLQNLMGNALRYSSEEKNALTRVTSTENEIQFEIINAGTGVDESEKEAIFEPFVQGQQTDSMTGGTGLGLFLCRKYSKLLGGSIALRNCSPQNTVFVLSIARQLKASPS